MRQSKYLILTFLLLLLCSGFTCNHRAAQISLGVAASLKAAQNGEINLHNAKQISDDEHRTLQEGFKTLFQVDKDVRVCIANTNVSACVDTGTAAVNDFLNSKVNGIKNPDSKQAIQLLGQSIIIALTSLKAAL